MAASQLTKPQMTALAPATPVRKVDGRRTSGRNAEFDLTTVVAGGLLAAKDGELLREFLRNTHTSSLRHKLFLKIKEAAEYTGLPATVIRKLVSSGQLPAVRTGGWRIRRNYLDALELRHVRRTQNA